MAKVLTKDFTASSCHVTSLDPRIIDGRIHHDWKCSVVSVLLLLQMQVYYYAADDMSVEVDIQFNVLYSRHVLCPSS